MFSSSLVPAAAAEAVQKVKSIASFLVASERFERFDDHAC